VAIAKERLKGTAEGKAYADRIRKFKGLEKVRRKRFKGFAAGNTLTEKWADSWHEKDMSPDMRKAITMVAPPSKITEKHATFKKDGRDTAYYSAWGIGIHMDDEATRRGRNPAVYRHEFGHHLDYQIIGTLADAATKKELRNAGPGSIDMDQIEDKVRARFGYSQTISETPEGEAALKADDEGIAKRQAKAAKAIRADFIKEYDEKWAQGKSWAYIRDDVSDELTYRLTGARFPKDEDLDRGAKAFKSKAAIAAWELATSEATTKGRPSLKTFKLKNEIFPRLAMYDKYRDPFDLLEVMERKIGVDDRGREIGGNLYDMTGAITKNRVGGGHSNEYYETEGAQNREAFANYVSLSTGGKRLRTISADVNPNFFKFGDSIMKEYAQARAEETGRT